MQATPHNTPHPRSHAAALCMAVGMVWLWIVGSGGAALRAQDQHFSMLDLDPLLFNPAYSGFYDGSGRFGIIYRNQWASVSTPFQTISASAEWALMRNTRAMNGLSGGLWLTADRAGTLGYGTTGASGIVSYFQGLGDGSNIVSVAAEVGVGSVGFSTVDIDLADPSESIARTRAIYPTLGAGVAWFWQVNDQFYTKLGLSARNLNQPDISMTGVADGARLKRRYNIYARAEWTVAPQWSVLPVAGFQSQQAYTELVYGCDVRYQLRSTAAGPVAVGAGIVGRHADAAAITLALLWHELTFAFCYDANISRLSVASHTLGAFEVGVVYMIAKKQPQRKALPCPIF